MIRGDNYGCKVDVWSATVVIFSLLTGNLPFYSEVKRDLIDQILNKDLDLVLSAYDLSDEARKFLIAGLERDQSKRLSCKELLSHEWLNQDEKLTKFEELSDCLNTSMSTASSRNSDLSNTSFEEEMEQPFGNVNHVLKKAVCKLLAGKAIKGEQIELILRALIKFISKQTTDQKRAKAEVRHLKALYR